MDYCKQKHFIAFINKDGKDRHWINGGFPWSETGPSLHPYETKEEKLLAKEIGESLSCWSETGDIEAVVLTVSKETISIMKKKDNALIVEKHERLNEEKKKKQIEDNLAKKKKKDTVDSETVDVVEVEIPKPSIKTPTIKPAVVSEPQNKTSDKKIIEKQNVPEKKRSPLELKSVKTEPKGTPTPSEPKKKSGLSKIMKGIK